MHSPRRETDAITPLDWLSPAVSYKKLDYDALCIEEPASMPMKDVEDALSDIRSIRHQMARSTEFRGYGPLSTGFSGILALGVAAGQSTSVRGDASFVACFGIWIATAFVALLFSGIETLARSRRVHSGLAQEMIQAAIEQFVPALVVGLLLTVVLMRANPDGRWMLPGLWEVIFSLGVFASCRFLPRQMFAVGVWYLVAGLCALTWCGVTKTFSPWAMGLPFGIGQLAVAAVLGFGYGGKHET